MLDYSDNCRFSCCEGAKKGGVAVILGGDFVIFGKTGGFVDIPKRVPTI